MAVAVRHVGTLVGAAWYARAPPAANGSATLPAAPAHQAAGSEDLAGNCSLGSAEAGGREHGEAPGRMVGVRARSCRPSRNSFAPCDPASSIRRGGHASSTWLRVEPEVVWRVGTALLGVDAGREQRFFEVFEASFRDRPATPGGRRRSGSRASWTTTSGRRARCWRASLIWATSARRRLRWGGSCRSGSFRRRGDRGWARR